MPGFSTDNTARAPFGKNEYRRSTKGLKYESYTFAQASITAETIDSTSLKVLQSGECIAKITSGGDSGKVGPYQGATNYANEVQTVTINATGGTWTLTIAGETATALAYNITASALQTAINDLDNVAPGDVVVTGGPGATAALTLTYGGKWARQNVPAVSTNAGGLTGGAGTAAVATTTAGTAGSNGASDGRGDPANIVGFNDTFLPWQLNDDVGFDREIAVCYDGVLVQAWCFERDASGARIALSNATVSGIYARPGNRLSFV